MLDVIANVKIDESKPERVKMFIASLRSCYFLNSGMKIIINLDNPSQELYEKVYRELFSSNIDFNLTQTKKDNRSYGEIYTELIELYSKNNYILNFIEDHFFVIDSQIKIYMLLSEMDKYNIDVCKSTFFQVEQNSIKDAGIDFIQNNNYGFIFENNRLNFEKYQRYYVTRYYIGVNFITTKKFALKFWNRPNIKDKRPHPYEIACFDRNWLHNCIIPNIEIQASIDDNHGEPKTCLLERNVDKFRKIWSNL